MPILKGPITTINKDLSQAERDLGVDLKLTGDNDLQVNNFGDIDLIAGVQNAAQVVKVRLGIEPGGLLFHPDIGTDLLIGEKTKNAFEIKTQIIRSLIRDDRFDNVDVDVTVNGGYIFVDLRVKLVIMDLEVPLQFAVPT